MRIKSTYLIVAFLLSVITQNAFGQLEFPEDKVKTSYSIQQNGTDATVTVKATIVPKWHINAINLPEGSFLFPTKIKLTPNKNFKTVGTWKEPKPHFMHDDLADEDLYYHEKTVSFTQKIKVLATTDFEIKGTFEFQTCNDVKCLPNATYEFSLMVKAPTQSKVEETPSKVEPKPNDMASTDDGISEAVVGAQSNTEEPAEEEKNESASEKKDKKAVKTEKKEEEKKESNQSLWTIFLAAFASGFIALLTPCVFPMIPMTVSFFTKQSKTKAEGIRNASIYGASIIAIYIVLGVVVTAIFGADALNNMATNPWFNLFFFVLLVVFAISFMGAFEIRMPSKWVNAADSKADKGGLIGIFFMALVLALVSFSCTGPIVGSLLVEAASKGGIAPVVGMFGFSSALAIPFVLFAAFPGWMNSLPQSGGWLNTVKVVLGFLELALAFKFLSNADLSVQAHLLERELFLAIWIAVFTALTLYLFGFLKMPHDSPLAYLSVGRVLLGITTLMFVLYMIPGLFGAPLKLISAFPPPSHYSESPYGLGGGGPVVSDADRVDGMKLGPQKLMVFHEYDEALAYAKEVNKPLFVDFTGVNCVNCRRMEESVWGEPGIIDHLRDDVVIVSLHVDERIDLPKEEQVEVEMGPGRFKVMKTTGDKWMHKQISEYQTATQPYYVMQDPNGNDLGNGSADYENHSSPKKFRSWLEEGLSEFDKK